MLWAAMATKAAPIAPARSQMSAPMVSQEASGEDAMAT